jgi:glycosyltransferase involved in cell wall biosynthesis
VHPTRYEGSSLVTLEAMAHGRPVVATRAGGIPDKVRDGQTGRLVAPGDVDGLAAALADLAADPSRRQEMGRRGRARAEADFAWERIIERVLALYRSLL